MVTENALEDAEELEDTVEKFLTEAGIQEEDLYIDLQIELDETDEVYLIEYGIKEAGNPDSEVIADSFTYEELEDVWMNYLDQRSELDQSFPEATVKSPHPTDYKAAKGGGNPALRLTDTGGELE